MEIELRLTGRSPLLMHNIRLADPDDPIVEEIAKITAKRKKTKEDRADIARLEWRGGLYTAIDQNGDEFISFPTFSIRRTLEEAAKVNRLGTAVRRAVSFTDIEVPLGYPGPEDIDKLYEDSAYRNRALVGVKTSRVVRVRPQFKSWSLIVPGLLVTNVLDFEALVDIARLAGLTEGLGDFRTAGFGRFDVEVVELA